jgi:hypothetical protein
MMPAAMLRFIAQQVGAEPSDLAGYAARDQTRREHAVEVMREYDFAAFSVKHYRASLPWLTEQARGTDNGLALVIMLTAEIRRRRIVVPTLPVVERLALTCRVRARQEAYAALSADRTSEQRSRILEADRHPRLEHPTTSVTVVATTSPTFTSRMILR